MSLLIVFGLPRSLPSLTGSTTWFGSSTPPLWSSRELGQHGGRRLDGLASRGRGLGALLASFVVGDPPILMESALWLGVRCSERSSQSMFEGMVDAGVEPVSADGKLTMW